MPHTHAPLQGCTIYLLGHMPALRMLGLRDTRVFTGPVTGACFADDLQRCTLVLASYQVCRYVFILVCVWGGEA